MTCGIYLLRFDGTNKVYVGQSLNIENRFTAHKRKMTTNSASIKMQLAYNMFGYPSMEILLDCKKENLDTEEAEAIGIFNAVTDGFNTSLIEEAFGGKLEGENVPTSKYSNARILEVFNILVDTPNIPIVNVALITGVSECVVRSIAGGTNHRRLEKEYPNRYATMLACKGNRRSNSSSAKGRGKTYQPIISPEGDTYTVENIRKFSLEHKINAGCINQVLLGKVKQHKGWKLHV